MALGGYGYNGKTRAENALVVAAARKRALEERVTEFVTIAPGGREDSRHPDIMSAIDAQRPLGVGAAVVTPDGRLLAYVADAVSAHTAMVAAERSVDAWRATRLAVQ